MKRLLRKTNGVVYAMFSLQIIFLETICNDRQIIERNIRLKIQQSPDYAEEYDSKPSGLIYCSVICIHVRISHIIQIHVNINITYAHVHICVDTHTHICVCVF